MINGAWPEGTRLTFIANRDPNEANGAWHTEGRQYVLEVCAEDDDDRYAGVANHLRLVDCALFPRAPQGVFKPEKLRTATEEHWQLALRDADGHNFKQRVEHLKRTERKLPKVMRVDIFIANDIMTDDLGWSSVSVYGYSPALHRFRVVYDVDTARESKKGEKDIDTWEDLLMLSRKLHVRVAKAQDVQPAALKPLYLASGREAEFVSVWTPGDWRVVAVQALDRACKHESANSFLKPAQDIFTDLRKPKQMRIYHGQIGGSGNATDLGLMRRKLGSEQYADLNTFKAELDQLVHVWEKYEEAGGLSGELMAKAARELKQQVELELDAVASGARQPASRQPTPPPAEAMLHQQQAQQVAWQQQQQQQERLAAQKNAEQQAAARIQAEAVELAKQQAARQKAAEAGQAPHPSGSAPAVPSAQPQGTAEGANGTQPKKVPISDIIEALRPKLDANAYEQLRDKQKQFEAKSIQRQELINTMIQLVGREALEATIKMLQTGGPQTSQPQPPQPPPPAAFVPESDDLDDVPSAEPTTSKPSEAGCSSCTGATGSGSPGAAGGGVEGGGAGASASKGLHISCRVSIVGLVKKPELNGRLGVVTAYDGGSERYTIQLEAAAGETELKTLAVREANLHLAPAPGFPQPSKAAPPCEPADAVAAARAAAMKLAASGSELKRPYPDGEVPPSKRFAAAPLPPNMSTEGLPPAPAPVSRAPPHPSPRPAVPAAGSQQSTPPPQSEVLQPALAAAAIEMSERLKQLANETQPIEVSLALSRTAVLLTAVARRGGRASGAAALAALGGEMSTTELVTTLVDAVEHDLFGALQALQALLARVEAFGSDGQTRLAKQRTLLEELQQQWAPLRQAAMAWVRQKGQALPCVAYVDDRCRLHLHRRGYATLRFDAPGRMDAAVAAVREAADAPPRGRQGSRWTVRERSERTHPLDEAAARRILAFGHSPRYISRQLDVLGSLSSVDEVPASVDAPSRLDGGSSGGGGSGDGGGGGADGKPCKDGDAPGPPAEAAEEYDSEYDAESEDTFANKNTKGAVLATTQLVAAALDDIVAGSVRCAFACVRPPGHHAGWDGRAGEAPTQGFCFFNSIACAAKRAVDLHGLPRVCVIDIDVHHGNGTEEILAHDPRCLFISLHAFGKLEATSSATEAADTGAFYPGTGGAERINTTTHNEPLPLRYTSAVLEQRWDELQRRVLEFRPSLLLLSSGFDAHEDDPSGGGALTTEDFRKLTSRLAELAWRMPSCRGRVLSVLEGGYHLQALRASIRVHLDALLL